MRARGPRNDRRIHAHLETERTAARGGVAVAAHDMRVAVAVRWYAQGIVSQGRAAEIAGMPRSEFMRALSDFEVSPFQESADEVREALARG